MHNVVRRQAFLCVNGNEIDKRTISAAVGNVEFELNKTLQRILKILKYKCAFVLKSQIHSQQTS